MSRIEEFASHFGFPLDDFQIRAIDVIDSGESVVVSAPTGSGKTVIGEYAISRTVGRGSRAFYTTPVKALSNQKFSDLCTVFGRDRVGLLTGDNVINPDADIVVMTTEVLRNMLYARSHALTGLDLVVLDEVHFIQDAYRGPVWEEVIIHLPKEVVLVCLSATVSNAREVAEWMTEVRGPTRFVVEEHRPVELEVMIMIGDRAGQDVLLPIFEGGGLNPRISRLTEPVSQRRSVNRTRSRRPLVTPKRIDVISLLRDHDHLPAIYFIFSRQGCDQAADSAARELPTMTTPEQRRRIAEIVEDRIRGMDEDDLRVLGFDSFLQRLEKGIAAHHAGMVPPFKEVVERCFSEGLLGVVFATETLAVGINMPARSVVIDKLTKFTGEHHEFLSAAQFTQLTGRAGRRGLDDKGHAILLWTPFVTIEQMASLAASRSFRLTSSFRPTYNMAVNLVRSYPRDKARHLLNLSLAQFQSDRDVVKLESRLESKLREIRSLEAGLHTPFGTPLEYLELATKSLESNSASVDGRMDEALSNLRPGSVIHVTKGNYSGMATVLSTTKRARGWKVTVLNSRRALLQLNSEDFISPPVAVTIVDLPQPFVPSRQDFQKKVVERASRALRKEGVATKRAESDFRDRTMTAHSSVVTDPDLKSRLIEARKMSKLQREVASVQNEVDRHSSSISRTFDRVLHVLETLEYVSAWSLTPKGEMLSRLFHESDLLISECIHAGILDDLDAPSLAGLVSVFVYEHRSGDPPPEPWFPSKIVRSKWRSIEAMSSKLRRIELDQDLVPHRVPDPTYVSVAFAWAAGEGFADIIDEEELAGGDFVRNIKQVIDLLRQFSLVVPNEATRKNSAKACELLLRGVVEASSTVSEVA